MNRRETPPGAPHPPISSGLQFSSHQLTVGQPEPLVKPASEAAHQPGQQPAAVPARLIEEEMSRLAERHESPAAFEALFRCLWLAGRPRLCGGVQRGEIKSAGETTGGARGGSRLGHPSDGDG